jgi:hypothetical protein
MAATRAETSKNGAKNSDSRLGAPKARKTRRPPLRPQRRKKRVAVVVVVLIVVCCYPNKAGDLPAVDVIQSMYLRIASPLVPVANQAIAACLRHFQPAVQGDAAPSEAVGEVGQVPGILAVEYKCSISRSFSSVPLNLLGDVFS